MRDKCLQRRKPTCPPLFCKVVTPLLQQWQSNSAAALPITGSFSAFSYGFFFLTLFHLSFFPPLLFLFVSWLAECVTRLLCCVVFDSSLGAELSLTRLLSPTIFLKSVSINIIIPCSRRHWMRWMFYCNVQQNTPHRSEKVSLPDRNFSFYRNAFVRSVSSVEVFCFPSCLRFCALGKVPSPCLIKVIERVLLLVKHLLLTLNGNRPRCAGEFALSDGAVVISGKQVFRGSC